MTLGFKGLSSVAEAALLLDDRWHIVSAILKVDALVVGLRTRRVGNAGHAQEFSKDQQQQQQNVVAVVVVVSGFQNEQQLVCVKQQPQLIILILLLIIISSSSSSIYEDQRDATDS